MYICLCHGITDTKIKSLLKDCETVKDLQKKCDAGTDCGACIQSIRQLKEDCI